MVLPWNSLSAWRSISIENQIPPGLATFYHESVHAFLDLQSDNPKFSKFIEDGSSHYQGAMLRNGKSTSDPGRLFQEAAGIYVENRVNQFYNTLLRLKGLACDDEVMLVKIREMLADTKQSYADAANKPILGYERQLFQDDPVETTRDISPEIKSFLDRELLEGKIPYNFDDVEQFRALEKEALDRIRSIEQPSQ
jgi:hypothetical protein